MTKENWLRIRVMGEIPLYVFYEYYLEKCKECITFEVFENVFPRVCYAEANVHMGGAEYSQISYSTALNRLFNYYDTKFDLCMT